jgi:hypothetical protein
VLLRLQENTTEAASSSHALREVFLKVAGTLFPQESCTFRSNQLANEGSSQKTIQKQQSFRKEPKNKTTG